MDKCLFSHIKNSKAFKKKDFFIYFIAIILVATIFLCVFLTNDKTSTGFDVSINGKAVLHYDFNTDTFTTFSDDTFILSIKETATDKTFTVKSGKDFDKINVIAVNLKNKSVSVIDANCPHGDCKTFTPLSVKRTGVIYCATHGLQISSVGDGYRPPVSGD